MAARAPFFFPLLQSSVVPKGFFISLAALMLAGCRSMPETYAPPVQRQPLTAPAPAGSAGYFVSMSDPLAGTYIVRDVSATTEGGSWRWTYRRPGLRFFLPVTEHLKFTMDFAFPERLFRQTGPVTLTFRVNGQTLDTVRYEKGGHQRFEKAVPASMVRTGENFVEIVPDRVWVSPTDGAALGFILSAAGFVE